MKVRFAIVVVTLAAMLVLPVVAPAAITRLDLGAEADLGPEGAFVLVPVTYQCDFTDGMIFISVQVQQSRGNRIASGSGGFQGPCGGGPRTVLVQVQSFGVPFHHGRAVASAFASTFISQSSDGPEEIRISS
jgi:hypothetical protein